MPLNSEVISRSRVLLQDSVLPYRYSDAELLVGLNDAIKITRKVRPDAFVGRYTTPIADYLLGDQFPISAEYEILTRQYVVAYANFRESEDSVNGKAAAFLGFFEKGLMAL